MKICLLTILFRNKVGVLRKKLQSVTISKKISIHQNITRDPPIRILIMVLWSITDIGWWYKNTQITYIHENTLMFLFHIVKGDQTADMDLYINIVIFNIILWNVKWFPKAILIFIKA